MNIKYKFMLNTKGTSTLPLCNVLWFSKYLQIHDPNSHRTVLREMEQLLLIPFYTWGNRLDC